VAHSAQRCWLRQRKHDSRAATKTHPAKTIIISRPSTTGKSTKRERRVINEKKGITANNIEDFFSAHHRKLQSSEVPHASTTKQAREKATEGRGPLREKE